MKSTAALPAAKWQRSSAVSEGAGFSGVRRGAGGKGRQGAGCALSATRQQGLWQHRRRHPPGQGHRAIGQAQQVVEQRAFGTGGVAKGLGGVAAVSVTKTMVMAVLMLIAGGCIGSSHTKLRQTMHLRMPQRQALRRQQRPKTQPHPREAVGLQAPSRPLDHGQGLAQKLSAQAPVGAPRLAGNPAATAPNRPHPGVAGCRCLPAPRGQRLRGLSPRVRCFPRE